MCYAVDSNDGDSDDMLVIGKAVGSTQVIYASPYVKTNALLQCLICYTRLL